MCLHGCVRQPFRHQFRHQFRQPGRGLAGTLIQLAVIASFRICVIAELAIQRSSTNTKGIGGLPFVSFKALQGIVNIGLLQRR